MSEHCHILLCANWLSYLCYSHTVYNASITYFTHHHPIFIYGLCEPSCHVFLPACIISPSMTFKSNITVQHYTITHSVYSVQLHRISNFAGHPLIYGPLSSSLFWPGLIYITLLCRTHAFLTKQLNQLNFKNKIPENYISKSLLMALHSSQWFGGFAHNYYVHS